jgi:2,3-bisphosphoglycerate-dependent phosphoglycerate mutase
MLKQLGRIILAISVLSIAPAAPRPTTVYVTRHAEADRDTGVLTERGRQRAQSLQDKLQDAGIKAIYVSSFPRTQDTAAPLAAALGITSEPRFETATKVKQYIDNGKDSVILVVFHSNTVPDLLRLLGVPEEHVSPLGENDYGYLFKVTIQQGGSSTVEKLSY